jgi:cytoskeleton protein RodZ
MSSVGKVLRGARLEQRLDLPTVSARTKISVRYLEAIEADDRRSLPSGFFYKSFVDQYARFLGLDTPEINAEVDRLVSADAPLPLPGYESVVSRNVPPIGSSSRFGKGRAWASLAALVAVVVGCSGVYTLWRQGKLSDFRSVLAKRIHSKPSAEVATGNVAVVSAHKAAPPKPSQPSNESTVSPVAAGYKVLLDLMAREETWLSVTSDGKHLFSGVLAPHQTKTLEGKESAVMKVGNAAGLEVRLNGKLLGPLGARGQVLVVLFTPDKFEIVPPAPREGD